MNASSILRRRSRPFRPKSATHLFSVGQAVRLKAGIMHPTQAAGIYHITGTLPPIGAAPQYRIRNDRECHERVTTQDNLEPVSDSDDAILIKNTFGQD
jgi:hypothetical protein